ncbi:tetratricopeptide repeat protein [Longitalea luteola]|uniref:tetratricopeptide repeat protein n=1 Tax=Longitalea luteola TaxID=2812563 RepID=UPI001A95A32F|nr:hypothetical protein [Longitalea luteola]
MEGRNEQLLINYLDRTLEEKEMREMEALINNDQETRRQWEFLQLAVEAVEYSAIYDQVAAVKENFRTIQPAEVLQPSKKGVRVQMRTLRRVAAVLLFCVAGAGAYKYFSVSATRVYQEAFIAYTLPTTRGQATITDIEQAYRQQEWQSVIAAFNTIGTSSLNDNKTLFLAGMAHLQLHQYASASTLFDQVLANNIRNADDLYQDEAQFYGALTHLANHDTQQAIALLTKIRADKGHLYHEQAARIGNIDLQILKIKGGR